MPSRRNKLLKLSQPELIKICKLWKVSTNGTKQEMVDRIMAQSPEQSTEQSTDTQKEQMQTHQISESKIETKDDKSMNKTQEKDELITFLFTVEIDDEVADDFETDQWDTNCKTIHFKKNEITYTLLHNKIEEIYPIVLHLNSDADSEYSDGEGDYQWNIYDQNTETHIINDETLIELIHKHLIIDLLIRIMYSDGQPLVIDNGSYFIKSGFGGDDAPRAVFPTIVGRPKGYTIWSGIPSMPQRDAYVGDEAQSKRGILQLKRPIDSKRQISSWDDMEKIWHHTFYNELRIQPEEHAVLLTDSPCSNKYSREKIIQIMFETFNVLKCYIGYQPVLALIASGRKNGIVLDSGWNNITECTPIYNGKVISEGITVSYFGGQYITEHLCKLLRNKQMSNGWTFTTSAEKEIARDIKEKLCYVKNRDETDNKQYNCSKNYELPDGVVIEMSDEDRYIPAECLFNPKLMGRNDDDGIHELIYKCIMKCNVNIQYELSNNIILCGGNTMFPGIKERLMYELEHIKYNNEMVVNGFIRRYNNNKLLYNDIMNLLHEYSTKAFKVVAPPERKYSVWIGGSMLSRRTAFEDKWITKEQYDEFGPGIVHKKCHTVSQN